MKTAKNKLEPEKAPKRESGKTLVAYVTKGGATGDAANILPAGLEKMRGS
jgi:hypothetical protein